jgi:ATP-binding cassette subfamily C (CFTR/MRP) protein 1
VETDAKIQRTIQMEFASSTLLCIAHRLNTIGTPCHLRFFNEPILTRISNFKAYYDRVIVMDGGKVAEFDTVLNLFDKPDSIFRSLCDEANLQRTDIVRIRAEHNVHV